MTPTMVPRFSKRRKLEHDADVGSDTDLAELGEGSVSEDQVVDRTQAFGTRSIKDSTGKHRKQSTVPDNFGPYSGDVHNIGIFKLQVDEMLSAIKPNYRKRSAAVDNVLHQLKSIIDKIPDRKPLSVC